MKKIHSIAILLSIFVLLLVTVRFMVSLDVFLSREYYRNARNLGRLTVDGFTIVALVVNLWILNGAKKDHGHTK
jgi:hypothetical protein